MTDDDGIILWVSIIVVVYVKLKGHVNIDRIFALGIFFRISGVKSVGLFLKRYMDDSVNFCGVLLEKRHFDLSGCRMIKPFIVNTF